MNNFNSISNLINELQQEHTTTLNKLKNETDEKDIKRLNNELTLMNDIIMKLLKLKKNKSQ
jgi:hypothetical protein